MFRSLPSPNSNSDVNETKSGDDSQSTETNKLIELMNANQAEMSKVLNASIELLQEIKLNQNAIQMQIENVKSQLEKQLRILQKSRKEKEKEI